LILFNNNIMIIINIKKFNRYSKDKKKQYE